MSEELNLERVFVNWLRINVEQSKTKIDSFEGDAKVIASCTIHLGVSIKLNQKQWSAKKKYAKAQVVLENKAWVYKPIV
jgi:hypothetical protein